jgi:acyl carrier protein
MDSTSREICRILTDELGCDLSGVGHDDSLLDAGILDSMAVLELVNALERRFGIQISDDEMMPETLGSIDAIRSLLARRDVSLGA